MSFFNFESLSDIPPYDHEETQKGGTRGVKSKFESLSMDEIKEMAEHHTANMSIIVDSSDTGTTFSYRAELDVTLFKTERAVDAAWELNR